MPAELIFTYAWALLTPLVMYAAKRYPVWGQHPKRHWSFQLGAMVAFVVVHIAIFSLALAALDPRVGFAGCPRLFGQSLLAWTVLDALVFCVIVIVHHAVVYYRVSKDRAIRASQLEARLAQTQLQMLRMQLQPHFLFNTLHSISALMHKDVRRADSMVAALSDLLRMSLQNIGAQEVPLQSELDFLQRYVEIMSLRFGDRLKVSIDIDPGDARRARAQSLPPAPRRELVPPRLRRPRRRLPSRFPSGATATCCAATSSTTAAGCAPVTKKASASRALGSDSRISTASDRRSPCAARPARACTSRMAIPFHPYDRAAAD